MPKFRAYRTTVSGPMFFMINAVALFTEAAMARRMVIFSPVKMLLALSGVHVGGSCPGNEKVTAASTTG